MSKKKEQAEQAEVQETEVQVEQAEGDVVSSGDGVQAELVVEGFAGPFPPYATLPEAYQAATLGYEIVASKQTLERSAEFAKCVHVVAGFALARTLGEPNLMTGVPDELTAPQVEAFVNFANACRDHEGGSYASANGILNDVLKRIDWAKLAEQLAPLLISLLLKKQQQLQ